MRISSVQYSRVRSSAAAAGLALVLALGGCGLDKVQVPALDGPSELALSVRLTAQPDVITADGFSTSLVTATLRDQNAQPISGRDIFFAIADGTGRFADIGQLRSTSANVGVGTGLQVRTNGQGIAAVVYEAPARTDATANQFVKVMARPVSDDASTSNYRSVDIELRSAESRLFPEKSGNLLPTCSFTVEVTSKSTCSTPTTCTIPLNASVLFQSTAADADGTIIRYFWSFGNGKTTDSPDASTSYSIAGTYVVRHLVTDNNGGQSACQATITAQ
jgi:hypothetical protein